MYKMPPRTCLLFLLGICLVFCLFWTQNKTQLAPEEPSKPSVQEPPPPAAPETLPEAKASKPVTPDKTPKTPEPPQDAISDIRARVDKEETREVSESEQRRASKILSFANQADTIISEGWFSQADHIAFFVRIYLGEWEFALLPKVKVSRATSRQRLLPPEGLFADELRQKMAEQITVMTERLDEMIENYGELTKYVQDTSVIDEGVRGKRLAKKLNEGYERFSEARKAYFSLLESESLPAEDLFLAQAPLRRQIIAARSIFDLFSELSETLSHEPVNRDEVMRLHERLQLLVNYAEAPPFKDAPLKERAYRSFLKSVHSYLSDLQVGISEGFYPHVRKALNVSQNTCRTRYNDFARYLNNGE